MSFGVLKTARRNLGVRLGLWYALVFAASSIALLMVAYYLLAGAIGRKDREVLDARLQEYAAIYDDGGLPALHDAMQSGNRRPKNIFRSPGQRVELGHAAQCPRGLDHFQRHSRRPGRLSPARRRHPHSEKRGTGFCHRLRRAAR